MATGLSFLRNIQFKPFTQWKRRKASKLIPEQHMQAQFIPTLTQILPVTVRRTDTRQSFQLLCSHLSPREVQFRTDANLQEWEVVEVEVLLQGFGCIRMMGQIRRSTLHKVAEVENPGAGYVKAVASYTGNVEIWPTDEQEESIKAFLWRQTVKERI